MLKWASWGRHEIVLNFGVEAPWQRSPFRTMTESGERAWRCTIGTVILIIALRYKWLQIVTKGIKPLYLLFTPQKCPLLHALYDVM
jgi:hypothetical protein